MSFIFFIQLIWGNRPFHAIEKQNSYSNRYPHAIFFFNQTESIRFQSTFQFINLLKRLSFVQITGSYSNFSMLDFVYMPVMLLCKVKYWFHWKISTYHWNCELHFSFETYGIHWVPCIYIIRCMSHNRWKFKSNHHICYSVLCFYTWFLPLVFDF